MGTIFDVLITFNILLSYFWQLFWRSLEIGTIFCASGSKTNGQKPEGCLFFFFLKSTQILNHVTDL